MAPYVDPQTGRDTNDGLTPEKTLATLFAVNRLALAPGDTVLLKCGSVFEKQFLHLRCCGKKDCPITIAAYSEGPASAAGGSRWGIPTPMRSSGVPSWQKKPFCSTVTRMSFSVITT